MNTRLKRLIAVSIMAIFCIVSLPSLSFAYSDGLLNGLPMKLYTSSTAFTETNALTDNDTQTSVNLYSSNREKKIVYLFPNKADLTSFYYDITAGNASTMVYFYSEETTVLKPTTTDANLIGYNQIPTGTPGTVNVNYEGVKQIIIHSNYSSPHYLNEFDLFGLSTGPDTVPPSNVGSLFATPLDAQVQLDWTKPTDSDFSHVKILRDGLLIADNVTDDFYIDSGLENGQVYDYKIISVDTSGNESAGRSITSKPTNEDLIAPSEVTGISQDVTLNSITFDFVKPSDEDFDRVILYKDGVEYDSTTGSTFTVTGLSEATTYSFKFTTIDITGNESVGVIRSVTTLSAVDDVPPSAPTGLSHIVGNGSITLDWNNNQETDLDGYFVYLDGQRINATPIKSSYYVINSLTNSSDYQVGVTAVDKSGNESPISSIITVTPSESAMPFLTMGGYDLTDVADGVGVWFAGLWLILAFAVAIPLSFYIANRVKLLFLA